MKRLFESLLFLLLGAMASVLVAWICAPYRICAPDPSQVEWVAMFLPPLHPEDDISFWTAHRPAGFPETPDYTITDLDRFGASVENMTTKFNPDRKYDLYIFRSGFPILSMQGGEFSAYDCAEPTPTLAASHRVGVATVEIGRLQKELALLPIPVPFAINSTVWAVLLWVLFRWPFVLRRLCQRTKAT